LAIPGGTPNEKSHNRQKEDKKDFREYVINSALGSKSVLNKSKKAFNFGEQRYAKETPKALSPKNQTDTPLSAILPKSNIVTPNTARQSEHHLVPSLMLNHKTLEDSRKNSLSNLM
jgi:hypothetical protein